MWHTFFEPSLRIWDDITSGRHAPLSFRFILQPLVAAFFAYRAGKKDAQAGRPFYFWALVHDPAHRRDLIREGWQHVGKVFIVAIVMDAIYQFIAMRWVYPFEALMVAVILAVLPYLVFRGIVNRVLRDRRQSPGRP
jgi:hypothetical protein